MMSEEDKIRRKLWVMSDKALRDPHFDYGFEVWKEAQKELLEKLVKINSELDMDLRFDDKELKTIDKFIAIAKEELDK